MYTIQFNVHASKSGRVGAVEVKDSTLEGHGQAVEACMARVLEGSTLPVRSMATQRAPESRARPQSRALVANPAAGAAAAAGAKAALELGAAGLVEVVLSPAVLTGVGLIVIVAIVVYAATDKDSDKDERERCRKVKEAWIEQCRGGLEKSLDGMPFHKCVKECLDAQGDNQPKKDVLSKKELDQQFASIYQYCSGLLNHIVWLTKHQGTEAEFLRLKRAVAEVLAELGTKLLSPIYAKYPDLAPSPPATT